MCPHCTFSSHYFLRHVTLLCPRLQLCNTPQYLALGPSCHNRLVHHWPKTANPQCRCTVIAGLYSAPINRPHLLIFKRKKKLYINKPRLSISRSRPRDCGQASRHSRLCGQISRHGNSTAPIILTFTVNTSKPPRMGRWGQESSVRGTTSGFHSSLHSVSLSFALSMSLSSRGKSALELALSSSSRRVHTGRWSAVLRREAPRYATLRCAVKRSFRRRVYFLRSPRAYRARKHTENELYVWSRGGIAGWPAWGNASPV